MSFTDTEIKLSGTLLNALHNAEQRPEVLEVTCPHCAYVCDCASSLANPGAVPTTGDLSLCINCAGISIYTGPGVLGPAGKEDLLALDSTSLREVLAAQCLLRKAPGITGESS